MDLRSSRRSERKDHDEIEITRAQHIKTEVGILYNTPELKEGRKTDAILFSELSIARFLQTPLIGVPMRTKKHSNVFQASLGGGVSRTGPANPASERTLLYSIQYCTVMAEMCSRHTWT